MQHSDVRLHSFNSDWLRSKVGISENPELLMLTQEEMTSNFGEYSLIELRIAAMNDQVQLRPSLFSPFRRIDTQIHYRFNLNNLRVVENDFLFISHEDSPINFEDFTEFGFERFHLLPEITSSMIAERFAKMGSVVANEHPRTCGTVTYNGHTVGYVMASQTGSDARFELAVASKDSKFPGLVLYQKTFEMLRFHGTKRVSSSFSVGNIAALNIHSALGCRYSKAEHIFAWVNHGDSR